MATGCDIVVGTYADGEDEQVAGSLAKKIHDIISAHDTAKCHIAVSMVEGYGRPSSMNGVAVIYWED